MERFDEMSASASASRSDQLRANRERAAKAKREGEEHGLLTLNTVLRVIGQVIVTVELRDDTVLIGTLMESDAYMKCASGPHGASPTSP
jgi:uncharacterized protein with GYD domain